jgi:hypothetical protein
MGERHAAEQITRVSDVLTVWVEGYQRGVLGPDTMEVEDVLTEELEEDLHDLWPTSPAASRTLARWRDLPREHWMGGGHDDA